MQALLVGHLAKERVMRVHDEADDVFLYQVACFNVDREVGERGKSQRVDDLREEVVSAQIQFG